MRTTIYIPDNLIDEIREEAWKQRLSVSKYLIHLHQLLKIGAEEVSSGEKILLEAEQKERDSIKGVMRTISLSSYPTVSFQEGPKETDRQRYQRLHPKEWCPSCRNRNKDCVCDD